MRVYRTYFEGKTLLTDMWRGNPVLTSVLFGLPLGFLSLICYSICCSDIMDADDDEEGLYAGQYFIHNFFEYIDVGFFSFAEELLHEKRE